MCIILTVSSRGWFSIIRALFVVKSYHQEVRLQAHRVIRTEVPVEEGTLSPVSGHFARLAQALHKTAEIQTTKPIQKKASILITIITSISNNNPIWVIVDGLLTINSWLSLCISLWSFVFCSNTLSYSAVFHLMVDLIFMWIMVYQLCFLI